MIQSIQSALCAHTAKHFYSFQEEWAAAMGLRVTMFHPEALTQVFTTAHQVLSETQTKKLMSKMAGVFWGEGDCAGEA